MSANDIDPDADAQQGAAPVEGDPPIIVQGQEDEEQDTSASEGDPPIIVQGT
ncbi:MAG TPA: hypothetical protein VK363_17765 [Pyrinomonadaceae bacterium]|nr:hypothetical protein [Pyrinomonadaceae bacterium]